MSSKTYTVPSMTVEIPDAIMNLKRSKIARALKCDIDEVSDDMVLCALFNTGLTREGALGRYSGKLTLAKLAKTFGGPAPEFEARFPLQPDLTTRGNPANWVRLVEGDAEVRPALAGGAAYNANPRPIGG